MPEKLKVAVAGIGRMGPIHALHVHELAKETGTCELAALVDPDIENARRFAGAIGCDAPILRSVDELAESDSCKATVLATPTPNHREHSLALLARGHRVLLEKPLTGVLETDREFAAELDRSHPDGLMLAFQRRFDAPLAYAKDLLRAGTIGRVFKVYSSMEDSGPAPDGFKSPGILADMSIHNVDEILWLTERMPTHAIAIGSRIYSHALTTCDEDFDDALLCLHFEDRMAAQIQVTRNHVSGYRVESVIYGEEGQIHVGRFEQKPFEILVEAYGRRGRTEPLVHRVFPTRDYGRPLPEFIDRFGSAYKAEVAAFLECCRNNTPFPITHRDGLRAQEVIAAGMRAIITREQAAAVGSA